MIVNFPLLFLSQIVAFTYRQPCVRNGAFGSVAGVVPILSSACAVSCKKELTHSEMCIRDSKNTAQYDTVRVQNIDQNGKAPSQICLLYTS